MCLTIFDQGDSIFLSTPSARRATLPRCTSALVFVYFYPCPPRGGRLFYDDALLQFFQFLSTPSARRATDFLTVQVVNLDISIHALREEGDRPKTF